MVLTQARTYRHLVFASFVSHVDCIPNRNVLAPNTLQQALTSDRSILVSVNGDSELQIIAGVAENTLKITNLVTGVAFESLSAKVLTRSHECGAKM